MGLKEPRQSSLEAIQCLSQDGLYLEEKKRARLTIRFFFSFKNFFFDLEKSKSHKDMNISVLSITCLLKKCTGTTGL